MLISTSGVYCLLYIKAVMKNGINCEKNIIAKFASLFLANFANNIFFIFPKNYS